ncbi:hypothetical protein E5329_04120 [Petralouisia muris]|uniref:Uncharacterized protein n=1 Tax=Petralouisia muris TaxID=3032872 RepID=A0AC61S0X0_9FIRM|nr:hypothetical protein [Petralouisia muris]TGY97567.1 hypothetical protein E5329_04120 [Petralouisia muris]
MKTLYLHIGTPKTGTSAIQIFCKDNQETLKKKIFEVKVIVYLRRQDEFMYSWWNQMVKEGMKKSSLLSWEEMLEKRPVVQLDYYEKLQKIAAIVGKENITVRRFSRNSFVGRMIEADFPDSVGLEFSEEYQVRQQLTNSSLTKNCNEIKRILNHFSGGMESKQTICFGIV